MGIKWKEKLDEICQLLSHPLLETSYEKSQAGIMNHGSGS